MPKKTVPPPPSLAPVLTLVRHRSVGDLDECQVEILRQANESFPPAPTSCRLCLRVAS